MKKYFVTAAVLLITGIIGLWSIESYKMKKALEPVIGNGIYQEEERKFFLMLDKRPENKQ